jgi:hypothetical protein
MVYPRWGFGSDAAIRTELDRARDELNGRAKRRRMPPEIKRAVLQLRRKGRSLREIAGIDIPSMFRDYCRQFRNQKMPLGTVKSICSKDGKRDNHRKNKRVAKRFATPKG